MPEPEQVSGSEASEQSHAQRESEVDLNTASFEHGPTRGYTAIETLQVRGEEWIKRIGRDGVSFKPGINFLVGSNGCGKSSVLKAITDSPKKMRDQKLSESDPIVVCKGYFQLV